MRLLKITLISIAILVPLAVIIGNTLIIGDLSWIISLLHYPPIFVYLSILFIFLAAYDSFKKKPRVKYTKILAVIFILLTFLSLRLMFLDMVG
ncbi:MAG: hypothetical protein UX77_C0008G0002 [Parcubacteria group bacterium GW2011_GWA1_47_11]|uniref:Uncharacterized protein n=1 Tax=Candidatus Nomurabacteria bacterium GW2011_GWB1_47_6 TaxID=1618749 RepID=A0A0G1SZ37_9BACT|nr:MAG: hypothetical protein UX77_C0008G0002 [Parcubacteria group bacterium GW2011_GWA1_47_11]KKU74831.1 MAG: hypothetical protein UY01_C0026G0002 [Candidatus Nomurabacteria bacterium GW2011_GWB1_47_6]